MMQPKLQFANEMIRDDLQVFLPRFRRGAGPKIEYCFAWPFKACPHWLVILPGQAVFGTMSTASFLGDWMPSNVEARKTIDAHLKRHPDALSA